MLLEKLNKINNILNSLITLTQEDIKNIKEANHNEVFKNIPIKENLANEFQKLKNEIDSILLSRNKPIEEIFSKEEEKEFEKFKDLLEKFYKEHKLFAKLSFSVTNFYNALLSKIKNKKQITYDKDDIQNSFMKLKA